VHLLDQIVPKRSDWFQCSSTSRCRALTPQTGTTSCSGGACGSHSSVRRSVFALALTRLRSSCSCLQFHCTPSSQTNWLYLYLSALASPSTMSVTTTANPLTYRSLHVLTDYELHHTSPTAEIDSSLNIHPNPQSDSNPPDWPTDHRRVPSHRPINYDLDQSERRVFLNPAERIFIATMFLGVNMQAVSRTLHVSHKLKVV
jgi:hypothetical protein